MVNFCMVELDEPSARTDSDAEQVREALRRVNYPADVSARNGSVVVKVHDASGDPVDELTDKLNDAGVECMVYAVDDNPLFHW